MENIEMLKGQISELKGQVDDLTALVNDLIGIIAQQNQVANEQVARLGMLFSAAEDNINTAANNLIYRIESAVGY